MPLNLHREQPKVQAQSKCDFGTTVYVPILSLERFEARASGSSTHEAAPPHARIFDGHNLA